MYRYGFQGQEEDGELWSGSVSYKYRVEDARLGRFFSVDPLFGDFPYNSCYAFSENRLIDSYEYEGSELLSGVAYACSKVNTQEKAIRVADNLGIEGVSRNIFMLYSGGASILAPDLSSLARSSYETSSTKFAATAAFGPMGLAFMQSVDFVQGKIAQIESISKGGDEGWFAGGQLGGEVAITTTIGLRPNLGGGIKISPNGTFRSGQANALAARRTSSNVQKILDEIDEFKAEGGAVKINPLNSSQELNLTFSKGKQKMDIRIETHIVPPKYGGNGLSPQRHLNVDLYPNKTAIQNSGHKILDSNESN